MFIADGSTRSRTCGRLERARRGCRRAGRRRRRHRHLPAVSRPGGGLLGQAARGRRAASAARGTGTATRRRGSTPRATPTRYLFSEELFEEWEWSEHFAGQPEIERYLNYVVDRFDLRRHMQFGARVTSAVYDEHPATWTVHGRRQRACAAPLPRRGDGRPVGAVLPGRARARATSAARRTTRGCGRRRRSTSPASASPSIGTGSSGVQIVPAIADEVASLTVYQRTPNWCTPLNNRPITAEEQADLQAGFEEIRHTLNTSPSGFLHAPHDRADVRGHREERRAFFEQMWNSPGFSKLTSNYIDMMTEPRGQRRVVRVHGRARSAASSTIPATADKLIPKDHRLRREAPAVRDRLLRGVQQPERVARRSRRRRRSCGSPRPGIETADGLREFDIIVWATGFDFGTGALNRLGVRGRDGLALEEYWVDGPITFLGIQCRGFPNFFFPGGPHGASGNNPRYGGDQVDFIVDLLVYTRDHGDDIIEVTEAAEEEWTDHGRQPTLTTSRRRSSSLLRLQHPWEAAPVPINPMGRPKLLEMMADVVANDYKAYTMSRSAEHVSIPVATKERGEHMPNDFVVSGDTHIIEPVDLFKTRLPEASAGSGALGRGVRARRADRAGRAHRVQEAAHDRVRGLDRLQVPAVRRADPRRRARAHPPGHGPRRRRRLGDVPQPVAVRAVHRRPRAVDGARPRVQRLHRRAVPRRTRTGCARRRRSRSPTSPTRWPRSSGSPAPGWAPSCCRRSRRCRTGRAEYDPVWAAAQANGMPVFIHVATGGVKVSEEQSQTASTVKGMMTAVNMGQERPGPRRWCRTGRWAAATPASASPQRIIADLVSGGVCERFPDLHFNLIEFSAGWLVSYLGSMDKAWRTGTGQDPDWWLGFWDDSAPPDDQPAMGRLFNINSKWPLPLKPSEYVRRQIHVQFADDPVAVAARHITGLTTIMWGNDYPHAEGTFREQPAVHRRELRRGSRRGAGGHPGRHPGRHRGLRHDREESPSHGLTWTSL